MKRGSLLRRAVAVPIFALALLLVLYGVFALIYNDDRGAAFVTIMGQRMDAHSAGALSLMLGAMAATIGVLLARARLSRSS